MTDEKHIYQIAPKLWDYFRDRKNNGDGTYGHYPNGHLKVLATIANEHGDIQWAIFFGNKGSRKQSQWTNGDIDFFGGASTPLQISSTLKGLSWENERPLWIVPISWEACNEVVNSIQDDKLPAGYIPRIESAEIAIRNGVTSGSDWLYDFDGPILNPSDHKSDPLLTLSKDSILENLSVNGEWVYLKMLDDKYYWPVWLTTKNFATDDKLITFPAPACHIVNEKGKYTEHEIWLGVREKNKAQQIVNYPFISIDGDGSDCSIVWRSQNRLDDVLKTNYAEVDNKFPAFISEKYVATPLAKNVNLDPKDQPRINEILDQFEPSPQYDDKLLSWFIEEKEQGVSHIRTFYTRHFGKYFKLLGNNNTVKIIQIARDEYSHLFVRIFFISQAIDGDDSLWNKLTSRVNQGLQTISASSPLGIAVKIESDIIEPNYHYVLEWKTKNSSSLFACDDEMSYDLITTCLINDSFNKPTVNNKKITLPRINSDKFSTNESKGISLQNCSLELFNRIDLVNDNGTIFLFILKDFDLKETGLKLRDGALAFTLKNRAEDTNDLPADTKFGRFGLTLQLAKSQRPLFLWQWYWFDSNINIEKEDDIVVSYYVDNFSLPVQNIEASGQDLLSRDKLVAPRGIGSATQGFGERSEPALVIPLHNTLSNTQTASSYLLTFSENINVGQNYNLEIKLQELNPEANTNQSTEIRAVVIDTNPQLTSLVYGRFLQQPGYDDGAWVLARRSSFSEEAGGWEILDDSAETEGFHLILPSQAIGEAYVKGKHDEPTPIPDGEPQENTAIEYRFGAPAILRLAPERLERHYVSPPWNLRRIWGQPGDAAPGVPFLESQFELLYGLTGNLKPEKAFIAELASKLGEVPVPPVNSVAWEPTSSQKDAFAIAWKQYLQFYRAWKSRLAILEPLTDDDFGNATFDKNISFKPRITFITNYEIKQFLDGMEKDLIDTYHLSEELKLELEGLIKKIQADLKDLDLFTKDKSDIHQFLDKIGDTKYLSQVDDLSNLKKIGASLKYPITEQSVSPIANNDSNSNLLDEKIRMAHDKNGLAGGFHYGFESKAIYKEFWREAFAKGSSSGEIKALAHSCIGGYGKQIAKFASDKTVIKSNTIMGRTYFYAVERIGRIGVFWHKAKHVIEYERTVVPSKQFKGDQPEHLGRPLVRKVREYVEILEPVRSYPDFATDAADAPGSITACTFKSIIIPVLSAWGHDVWGIIDSRKDTIGWEVPLWKPGADPDIYPKPQIVLSVLAPADADEKAIIQNLSEPQNLWFYTDTREFVMVNNAKILITAEVHDWPAVQEVDFTNLPEPEQYDIAPAAGDSPNLIGQPMPDALDIMPGFERFTFRVDRNEIPSSVAGRYYSNAAITGRMRTAGMMRSKMGDTKEKEDWWKDAPAKSAKKALKALVVDKNSLLAQTANGFLDIENRIRVGSVSLENLKDDYVIKIKNTIESNEIYTSLKDISSTPVEKPRLHKEFEELWDKDIPNPIFSYPVKWLWREILENANGFVNRALGWYDQQQRSFLEDIDKIIKQLSQSGSTISEEVFERLEIFRRRIIDFQNNLEVSIDSLSGNVLNTINFSTEKISTLINNQFDFFVEQIDKNDPSVSIDKFKEKLDNIISSIFIIITGRVNSVFEKINKVIALKNNLSLPLEKLESFLIQIVNENTGDANRIVKDVKEYFYKESDQIKALAQQTIYEAQSESKKYLQNTTDNFIKLIDDLKHVSTAYLDEVTKKIKEIEKGWREQLRVQQDELKKDLDTFREHLETDILIPAITPFLYKDQPSPDDNVFKLLININSRIAQLEEIIKSSLLSVFGDNSHLEDKIRDWLKTVDSFNDLTKAIESGNIESIVKASQLFGNEVNQEFGRLVGEIAQKYRDAEKLVNDGDALIQTGKQTLNNFRSVWEEFTAPGMGLNRRTVAMIVKTDWKDVEQRLSITPCISRVKQFGEDLEGLGLRLPVTAIADRLLPSKAEWGEMQKSLLGNFDFSNLFSDLGGIRFDNLFPGFKMPEFARDKIKITHGFDRQNLIAWVNAEADIKFDDTKKLMSIGPLEVTLENGHFTGKMKLEIDIDGKLRKTNTGQLSGSWNINIAGTGLMIFRDTSVIFKDDKLTFDLDPKRMEMPGLLKLLTDATTTISDTGMSGSDENGEKSEVFKIGLVKVRDIPAGIRAALDIPPISVGGGTTAITNLSFGGHFELRALDDSLRFKFLLGFGFYLGKKEAPFTVTVFILGGGGYIDCDLTYSPAKGEGLTIDFVMSINVSATLAIAAGWATGFVSIMVGLEGEYHKAPNAGGSVYITIYVRVIGMVELLSIVSVFLFIGLEATYKSGNGSSELVGVGYVKLEIRICRFFKIKVEKSYTKRFAGSGGNNGSKQALKALRDPINPQDSITLKAINILKSLA